MKNYVVEEYLIIRKNEKEEVYKMLCTTWLQFRQIDNKTRNTSTKYQKITKHPFKSTQWAFCWWPAEPSRKGRVKTPLLGEAAACCVVLLQSVVWQGKKKKKNTKIRMLKSLDGRTIDGVYVHILLCAYLYFPNSYYYFYDKIKLFIKR